MTDILFLFELCSGEMGVTETVVASTTGGICCGTVIGVSGIGNAKVGRGGCEAIVKALVKSGAGIFSLLQED